MRQFRATGACGSPSLSGGGGGHHGGHGWHGGGGGWWGPRQNWGWGGGWGWPGYPIAIQVPDPAAAQQAQQALQLSQQAIVAAEEASVPFWQKIPWYGWLVIAGAAYMVLKPKRAVANRRRRRNVASRRWAVEIWVHGAQAPQAVYQPYDTREAADRAADRKREEIANRGWNLDVRVTPLVSTKNRRRNPYYSVAATKVYEHRLTPKQKRLGYTRSHLTDNLIPTFYVYGADEKHAESSARRIVGDWPSDADFKKTSGVETHINLGDLGDRVGNRRRHRR